MKITHFVLSLSLFLFIVINCQAQQQKGRLSDGRPYRVDQQGMRLSDYIAEIEVTNEELRQQVIGLEDEIAQANRKLTGKNEIAPQEKQIPVSSPELDKLQSENQILKDQILSLSQQLRASLIENAGITKQLQTSNSQNESLSKQLQTSNNQSENLSKQLQVSNSQNESISKQLQASLNDKENLYQDLINKNKDSEETYSQVNNNNLELKQKISRLEKNLLEQTKATAEQAEEQKRTVARLEQENTTKASSSSSQEEDIAKLKTILQEKDYEIASLKSSVNSQNQRAALVYTESPKAVLVATNTEPSMEKTIVSYKSELRGQLQKIQSLILQRKNSLDNLKNKKSGILVSIQPLVTSSGISLDKIRLAVDTLNREEDVSNIKSGLSEINKILNGDIEVINRLLH